MTLHNLTRRCVVLSLAMLALVSMPKNAAAQAAFEVVRGGQPIPRNGYKTWSLFLVTNQDWLVPNNNDRLQDLYYRFRAFGRVIGAEHLAVWFWSKDVTLNSPDLWEAVDVERAVAYCRKMEVRPSRGPYILFTTEYPDESAEPSSYQWIELDGMDARQIDNLLDSLGDQLLANGLIDDGEFSEASGSEGFWIAWFDATRQAIASVGADLRFRIQTPFLTIAATPDN